jgi:hypothetical protein
MHVGVNCSDSNVRESILCIGNARRIFISRQNFMKNRTSYRRPLGAYALVPVNHLDFRFETILIFGEA